MSGFQQLIEAYARQRGITTAAGTVHRPAIERADGRAVFVDGVVVSQSPVQFGLPVPVSHVMPIVDVTKAAALELDRFFEDPVGARAWDTAVDKKWAQYRESQAGRAFERLFSRT